MIASTWAGSGPAWHESLNDEFVTTMECYEAWLRVRMERISFICSKLFIPGEKLLSLSSVRPRKMDGPLSLHTRYGRYLVATTSFHLIYVVHVFTCRFSILCTLHRQVTRGSIYYSLFHWVCMYSYLLDKQKTTLHIPEIRRQKDMHKTLEIKSNLAAHQSLEKVKTVGVGL